MNIIEAKTTWGRWRKMILLCLIGLTPLVPLLVWLGYRRLQNIPEDDPNHKALKYSLYLGVFYICAVGGFIAWFFARTTEGENENQVNWLPKSVSNISYHRSWNQDSYEFTVNEEDFIKWCTKRKNLQEIREYGERKIERYAKFMKNKPKNEHYAVAKDGLYYEWTDDDSRIFKIMYDRQKQRAYIYTRKLEE